MNTNSTDFCPVGHRVPDGFPAIAEKTIPEIRSSATKMP